MAPCALISVCELVTDPRIPSPFVVTSAMSIYCLTVSTVWLVPNHLSQILACYGIPLPVTSLHPPPHPTPPDTTSSYNLHLMLAAAAAAAVSLERSCQDFLAIADCLSAVTSHQPTGGLVLWKYSWQLCWRSIFSLTVADEGRDTAQYWRAEDGSSYRALQISVMWYTRARNNIA